MSASSNTPAVATTSFKMRHQQHQQQHQQQQQHYADTSGRRPLSSGHVIWPVEVASASPATISTGQSVVAPMGHYDSIYNSVYESVYEPPMHAHFGLSKPAATSSSLASILQANSAGQQAASHFMIARPHHHHQQHHLHSHHLHSHLSLNQQPAPPPEAIQRVGGQLKFKWAAKQLKLSANWRTFLTQHQVILKFAILLLLALALLCLIKLGLPASMQSLDSIKRSRISLSPDFAPSPLAAEPADDSGSSTTDGSAQDKQQLARADLLKSRLLIGEFIISSQNYSYSAAQHLLLADRIVKLMDQVFLATEVRRFYSRTEVTNIRRRPPSGVIVNCNIILTESISYAAQQFGYALYDSLARSHERLAGQQSYVIDKSSIRFNTVPDKDLKSGVVPAGLLPASLGGPPGPEPVAPSVQLSASSQEGEPAEQQQQQEQKANSVVWSEWSQWSSCVDKNGLCDPTRLHSRIRTCVAQHTGERAESSLCKQRFGAQDQELEVDNCSRRCGQQQLEPHVLSDAPSVMMGPQTAPSVIVGGANYERPSTASEQLAATSSSTEQSAQVSSQASSEQVELAGSQVSCANCTTDEICLLLMQQKVPFCAKLKDSQDESGCGGWCTGQGQLCQPAGQNAFKCIHDSECLAEEWRCHDSACIPLSKRCDGHSNCYDSSDERDCPPGAGPQSPPAPPVATK